MKSSRTDLSRLNEVADGDPSFSVSDSFASVVQLPFPSSQKVAKETKGESYVRRPATAMSERFCWAKVSVSNSGFRDYASKIAQGPLTPDLRFNSQSLVIRPRPQLSVPLIRLRAMRRTRTTTAAAVASRMALWPASGTITGATKSADAVKLGPPY